MLLGVAGLIALVAFLIVKFEHKLCGECRRLHAAQEGGEDHGEREAGARGVQATR